MEATESRERDHRHANAFGGGRYSVSWAAANPGRLAALLSGLCALLTVGSRYSPLRYYSRRSDTLGEGIRAPTPRLPTPAGGAAVPMAAAMQSGDGVAAGPGTARSL